jgi:hypothetical protein
MAVDWIKIRRGMRQWPKTVAVARHLSGSRDFINWWADPIRHVCVTNVTEIVTFENVTRVTACALTELWFALNDVLGEDCHVPYMELSDIDDIVGVPGFGEAMLEVGWVAVHDEKGLVFPNFSEHNTPNKLRAEPKSDADRARDYRERKKDSERVTARHETSRPEEKRREEKILPPTEVATSEPPKRRKRSQPADAVSWSADAGWQGITDADRQEWRQAYPACDLTAELAKAGSWLKANPTRAHKSNWRRFVVSWLTRSQDKGGTNRTPGVRPDERAPPQPQANRRFFRSDAQRSMTDAEHAAWRRDQRQGGTVAALAGSIRLTEEVTQ